MPKFISDDDMAKMEEAARPKKRVLSDDDINAMEAAEKEGALTTGLNKFAQGASFNLTDELAGGLEALGSKVGVRGLGGKISDVRWETPEEDKMSFSDVYKERRDQNRARQKGEALAYPRTALGGELAGALTSGIMTGNPASLAGKVGLGAAEAGLQGFGSSEGKDLGEIARDTGSAAGMGGATAGVLAGAGKLADATGASDLAKRALVDPVTDGADKLRGWLTKNANERAVKAVYGQNKKAFDELRKMGRTQQAGADLLASDEAGAPVVGWLTRTEDAIPRLQAKKAHFGSEIGKVGETVDQIMPNAVVGADIAEGALQSAAKVPEGTLFDAPRNKLLQMAEDYQGKNLGWREAQDLKSALKFNPLDASTRDIGKEATNALNRSVSGAMDSAVDRAASSPGIAPEQAERLKLYQYLKDKYQTFRQANSAAENRATANLSNRFVSPSDMFVGGILGGANMINKPEDALGTGMLALGGMAANKALRGRGSAFAANAAKSVADFIGSGTATAQKYGPYLQRIFQEQGPENAALALYLIQKNDKQQRQGVPK